LMCRDPSLGFKPRIKFKKKDRMLCVDIMLDFDAMRCADDNGRLNIVAKRLSEEISRIIREYAIRDFDESRFLNDFSSWLGGLECHASSPAKIA
jgi:hypothetical protein